MTYVVQAPEEAKVFIPVLDDEFHDGRNLGAEDTRSSLSSEGNAEGGGADIDTGREQFSAEYLEFRDVARDHDYLRAGASTSRAWPAFREGTGRADDTHQ
ncbi:hypothetical protein HPB52_014055 [Rhipicephalus sanguineus]|uniref:Uncharacterized protein n=1 Tax=Rhipicephalus sanguineus TaxID=34632 RepID=A0A9D4PMU9_RHISA|nr:hypothetical protein HPB52_014055 [Rhipicephalus sanguineus]